MPEKGAGRSKKRLTALVVWYRKGGAVALKALADLNETPAEEDLPPTLEWEEDLWEMYWLLKKQWRVNLNGYTGLDLNVFIPVIEKRGWDLMISLELLSAIEDVMLNKEITS